MSILPTAKREESKRGHPALDSRLTQGRLSVERARNTGGCVMSLRLSRVHRVVIAMVMAAATLGAPIATQPATAYSCTITPVMFGYPSVVTAKVKWGPNCNTNYAFTMSVWAQTGPTDWSKLWQEMFPQVATTGGSYYWMDHGWACDVGVFKARAQIGGQTAWSAPMHCPD